MSRSESRVADRRGHRRALPPRACFGRRPSRLRWAGADGFVTAEAAVVLPVLVLLTAVLVAGIAAAAAQIRCVDAAQAGARALARGEPDAVATARVLAAAPAGARTEVVTRDGLVRYRVVADVGPPGALWAGVRFHVEHSAVAAVEGEAPP